MSVFTHGVNSKDKPRMVDHNKVFTVALANKTLRVLGGLPSGLGCPHVPSIRVSGWPASLWGPSSGVKVCWCKGLDARTREGFAAEQFNRALIASLQSVTLVIMRHLRREKTMFQLWGGRLGCDFVRRQHNCALAQS